MPDTTSSSKPFFCPLEARGILRLSGPDSKTMLQGMVSGDVERVRPDHAIWAAFLTPQGKYLFDFFIGQMGDDLVLDCEGARLGELLKRLNMYKLRADVTITDASDALSVFAAWGEGATAKLGLGAERGSAVATKGGVAFVDPRLAGAGVRVVGSPANTEQLVGDAVESAKLDAYEHLRISLGLPDASRDMQVDRALLLENGFNELDGVSFEKGCYIGQEVTARTRYRGLVKKRLLPVTIDGPAPEAGTPIMAGERAIGEMRTSAGNVGLALLRLEHLGLAPFNAGDASLRPRVPEWVELPTEDAATGA